MAYFKLHNWKYMVALTWESYVLQAGSDEWFVVIAGLRIISDKKKKAGSAWWITVTGTRGRNPISDGFYGCGRVF